jgi:exonuclease III
VLARKEFNEVFLPETGFVDAWREWHGKEAKGYSWFLRGAKEGTDCARVDMILVSKRLYGRTTGVEIEKWGGVQSRSDHAIMWIQIDGFDTENATENRAENPVS